MAIVYQYDKRHNVTYVYESHSYYDKEKKQSRSSRKILGRLDPATNEIVPTRKRATTSQQASPSESPSAATEEKQQALSDEISILRAQMKQMENQLSQSKKDTDKEHQKLVNLVNQLKQVLSNYP